MPNLERDPAALEEVLDSALLVRGLEARWPVVRGLLLAQISYDSTGARDTVTVYSEAIPNPWDNGIQRVVTDLAPERAEPRQYVALYLGDSLGPAPRRVRQLIPCAPRLSNERMVQAVLMYEAEQLDLDPERTVVLRLLIGASGEVQQTRAYATSGDREVDAAAARVARVATFEPSRIAGMAVASWVQIPIRLRYTPNYRDAQNPGVDPRSIGRPPG